MEKCAMLMKSGKRETTEEIELPNQERIKRGKLQILGNIRNGRHQTSRDERKYNKRNFRITRKLLETKLYSRNLIVI